MAKQVEPNDSEELTMEQRAQHLAVMKVASHNLSLVIDALQTLDHQRYDSIVDRLETAEQELDKLQREE